jgi:hypothetical protein
MYAVISGVVLLHAHIRRFPSVNSDTGKPETHYAIFDGEHLIAICNHESSAIAVRDDVNRRAGTLNGEG